MDYSNIMFRVLGHVRCLTDVGLWKLKAVNTVDVGRISVKWCQCPTSYYRVDYHVQIKWHDSPSYTP